MQEQKVTIQLKINFLSIETFLKRIDKSAKITVDIKFCYICK